MWWTLVCMALGADQTLLFVGNSYTDRNDLPGLVGGLLEEGAPGWDEVEDRRLTAGGWTFELHANSLLAGPNGHTDALIDGATVFDTVVLQEQSQTAGFDQAGGSWQTSMASADTLDQAIDDHGADTLFYLTWGRRNGDGQNPDRYPDFQTMQGHLTDGYLTYADALSRPRRPVFVAPAGLGFQAIWDGETEPEDPESLFSRLYAADGSHPSRAGSLLVAYVFYASLTGRSPIGLEYNPDAAVGAEDMERLAEAAEEVVLSEPFGQMRFPYALTWSEFVDQDEDVSIGGGAIRHQIRVEEEGTASTLALDEGVLHLAARLEVDTMTATDQSEVVFDGGSLVIASELPVSLYVAAVMGDSGILSFPGVSSWPADAFPAVVLGASTFEVEGLTLDVPPGYEAVVVDGAVVVEIAPVEEVTPPSSEDGEDAVGCGCAHSGAVPTGALVWAWLMVAARRRGYSTKSSIVPTSPATT